MDGLKPCPLCGGEAQEKKVYKPFFRGWVGCPECQCYINFQHDDKYARLRWNRRASVSNPDSTSIDGYIKRWEEEKHDGAVSGV